MRLVCTLLRGDVIGIKGIRDILVIRNYNTKGKQETREIQVHPQLQEYLAEHHKCDLDPEFLIDDLGERVAIVYKTPIRLQASHSNYFGSQFCEPHCIN